MSGDLPDWLPDDREARAILCADDDHRLCEAADCPHAAYWHPRVLEAARVALERTGRRWAVLCVVPVCVPDGEPRLLGTVADAWSATGWRNAHYKRHGGYDSRGVAAVHGWCYTVDSEPTLRIR